MGGQVGSIQPAKPAKRDKSKPLKSEVTSTHDKVMAESHFGGRKGKDKMSLSLRGSQVNGNKAERGKGLTRDLSSPHAQGDNIIQVP